MQLDVSSIKTVAGKDVGEMEIHFLRSYEHTGAARLTCGSGCACDPQVLNASSLMQSSVDTNHKFEIAHAGDLSRCVIALENYAEPEPPGGAHQRSQSKRGHKFKLLSMMVSATRHK